MDGRHARLDGSHSLSLLFQPAPECDQDAIGHASPGSGIAGECLGGTFDPKGSQEGAEGEQVVIMAPERIRSAGSTIIGEDIVAKGAIGCIPGQGQGVVVAVFRAEWDESSLRVRHTVLPFRRHEHCH